MTPDPEKCGLAARDYERFRNRLILAPMVRTGSLPLRLLALEYGADLVYSPEMVDLRLAECVRRVDGKIDSWRSNGHQSLVTHPVEKSRLTLQLGTANADTALQAALVARQDISAVDVNCGCPERFSLQGGMGAALLQDPDRLVKILCTLVQGLDIPVTCKIRLLPGQPETLALCRRLAATGISALAVHLRTRDERPRHPAHWDRLEEIVQALHPMPVILNGDVMLPKDVERARRTTGASSVMIARGAQVNVSIFRVNQDATAGLLPEMDVVRAFLSRCLMLDNRFPNTKYILMQMYQQTKSDTFVQLQRSKTHERMW
ncbi:hypothetical protein BJ684DRAFT_12772 [Piptocephalis cylindrospora]|uniref:tRNA-dihydrouridine synthase n=1 Tax=Piptocephalis cylindrospora TaxID=1907219 RepID=A0A4P9XYS0_9FUNG|nr:hypothetical protein BJ684DRAFT_12772 [Piptocephalis cylindrospora]|eukprot:RKP11547.1 hypothetical protein BJ684DRAFT_12772 [Piptocephalis cylindrospora]